MTRKHDTADGVRDGSSPLPNARPEDVQNDKVDASSTRTRRSTLRAIGGLAVGSTIVGAAAACDDESESGSGDLKNRALAKARGRTMERTGELTHLPTDEVRGSDVLAMGISGKGASAGDGDGTAIHTLHLARGNPETVWWHDRVDMTAFGGSDATEGEPVMEASARALAEGGDPVLLVAENDHGMLASPDAEHFKELLPDRIREEAIGLD